MAEDIMNELENNEVDYIQAIKELKENTVSRDAYMKLKNENKKLISNLVEGNFENAPVKEKVDIGQLRKELFNKDKSFTNLEYIDKALKLREAMIDQGQNDPFLPMGKQISPTDNDIATANKVARVLQECVDYADGNPAVFQSEMQRILADTPSIYKRRK